ncbi:hypothetical protein [Bradyrhizobium niftali]|jgi:hypothetical protein|uniref:DUF4142 domain-containing protein n=1 Tax=Bradyrhizobium niftali TaxID=2560055 RepID=A0A4Y9LXW2_9BRAD|nr:hypothetical protein [Bradyrhizobium niftali]TFV47732.1 hypothetical protein E4K65_16005 [Bradyrhizobium niftali]
MRNLFFILAIVVTFFFSSSNSMWAADEMRWPEAIGQLLGEKTRALTCARAFRTYASKKQLPGGIAAYNAAKADYDQIIGGLSIAIVQGKDPGNLSDLQTNLEHGVKHLEAFCKMADAVRPKREGEKGVWDTLLKLPIDELIKSVGQGVSTLYTDHRKDDELTRQTINNGLSAARWPEFEAIKRQ